MALRLDVGMGTSTSSTRSLDALARLGTRTSIQLGRMEKEILEIHEPQEIQIDRSFP